AGGGSNMPPRCGRLLKFLARADRSVPTFLAVRGPGKSTLRQLAEANFAQNESVTFSPINPQCRVIGGTGIVWGHMALTRKPKDGPLTTLFARFTFIFVKSDGQWREAAVHVSQLPTAG